MGKWTGQFHTAMEGRVDCRQTIASARRCPGPWQECRTDWCPVDGDDATTCHQPAEEGTFGSRYIRVVRVPRSQPRDIPVTIVST